MFRISEILSQHTSDVRGVACLDDNTFASVSRDKTSILWTREGSSFKSDKCLISHNGYVNSVTFIKHQGKDYLVTGGSDKLIYVWDISDLTSPRYTLSKHKDNVCTLSRGTNGTFCSGSWDKTAVIWENFSVKYTLTGHQSAVWAVIELDDGSVLTGSADKSIVRWREGKKVQSYMGHEDCVRSLKALSRDSFVSAANDGSLMIWNLNGDCLAKLYGHESFVYSISLLSTGEIVSSAEDRTVRIWKDNDNVQTIILPATSLWCTDTMPNGDIICGTSDSKVYIFSKNENRLGDTSTIKHFNELNAAFTESKKTKSSLNTENLPGPERLLTPGLKDQQVLMIKEGSDVIAYQWDLVGNEWIKVGTVTDAVGQERKQLFEGKEYDYVFSVDLEDGKPVKKLPYNVSENPYTAAQRFIEKSDISPTYLDEIANFIIKNSEGVSLGSNNENVDPFTGKNRYIPSEVYPKEDPVATKVKFSGIKGYVLMNTGNPSAIFSKILELNSKLKDESPSLALSDSEIKSVEKISSILSNPSVNFGKMSFSLKEIIKGASTWPLDYRFPFLDLLRLITSKDIGSHIFENEILNGGSLNSFIESTSQLGSISNETSAMTPMYQVRATMVMRMLTNLLTHSYGQIELVASSERIFEQCNQIQSKSPNKNLSLAISSFYINFSAFIYSYKSSPKALHSSLSAERIDSISLLLFESVSGWIGSIFSSKMKTSSASYDQTEIEILNRLVTVIGQFVLIDKRRYTEFLNSNNVISLIKGFSQNTDLNELSSVLALLD
ncbi:hypothetical protein BB560_001735 [Smittium megazygosporum]|uniref:PFU domain-containing protein n=1 Tax=Smittium megazygosporum TaxID=133381 RepID=A0A2T9ZGP8_9FUNG|nr:hypothetical protein BB560_001735 [Smittium megazygosporum]